MDFAEDELQEIIEGFLSEGGELLEQLDSDLVALEGNAGDTELLQRIFRNMHTLKGTANFLLQDPRFAAIGKIAHAAEDVMGQLREKKATLTPSLLDLILQAVDAIKALVARIDAKEESDYEPGPLVASIRAFLVSSETPASPDFKEAIERAVKDAADRAEREAAERAAKEAAERAAKEAADRAEREAAEKSGPTEETKQAEESKSLLKSFSEEDRRELLEDYFEESRELVDKIDLAIVQLEKHPDQAQVLDEIFRHVHTIKGTSAFLGIEGVSKMAHVVEDSLREIRSRRLCPPDLPDVLLQVVDLWKRMFYRREAVAAPERLLIRLRQLASASAQPSGESPADRDERPGVSINTIRRVPREDILSTIGKTRRIAPRSEQTVRVDTNRLDKLMNLSGELVLGRNRLAQVVHRLLEKYPEERVCQELTAAADFINYAIADLQMAVLRTRMQPIGKIFNRFSRTIRDLARELGKDVNLAIQGAETELDKSIIDELGDPLTHLLRNAVDHGIELPQRRSELGKAPAGTIALSAFQEGNQIIIEITDDGKGMDAEVIRKKAVSQGLVDEREAQRLTSRQILDFIFVPGFSTAETVTGVSGRGVGMDVVKSNIEKLNGAVELKTEIGKGSVFRLRFPLTLATLQVLQVSVFDEMYAIPLSSVFETVRVHSHQIQTVSGKAVIRFRDAIVPLVRLDEIFEVQGAANAGQERIYVVVAGVADKRVALVVERIIRREEIVIKSLGQLLSDIPGISGACIGGDGRVILILDIPGLLRLVPRTYLGLAGGADFAVKPPARSHDTPPCALIVEDSRSERKRTRMLMQGKGFKVIEAVDGKDALGKLAEQSIDIVITDIEMPGLDGYQLTSKIREYAKYRETPVIAVSSHKEMVDRIKGMEAGIDAYLPKPLQEDDLFAAIKPWFS